jgi:hypothetical protein
MMNREDLKRLIYEETDSTYSGVEGWIRAMRDMTSGKQKDYYSWLYDSLKKVPVKSYRDSEVLTYHIDHLRERMPNEAYCQKKGCYDTAYYTSAYIRDIDIHYVEGYVQAMIPIQHAWNYYPEEDIYFDLINDVAWDGEDSSFTEYYEVINTHPRYELPIYTSLTGEAGGFLNNHKVISEIMGW